MTMPAQFPALQQRGLAKFIKLALDFSANETLDSRITFSRTSNATRVNAQGLIEYAPHNLLTYSENFDNAVWSKFGGATVTANTVIAPDGTLTADTLNITTGGIYQQISASTTVTYVFSIYLKAASNTTSRLVINTNLSDPVAQTVSVTTSWQRFTVTKTVSAGTNTIAAQIDSFSGANIVYAWGAQLNIGSLQPYYTTSVKNLLGYSQNFENAAWTKSNSSVLTNLLTYSQEFDNAAWAKPNATVTANAIAAPDGTTTADKLVENTVNTTHAIAQNLTYSTSPYTLSVYAKAGERSWIMLNIWDGTTSWTRYFNLLTGSVGSGSSPSHSISSIGSGWYRCSITVTPAIGTGQNSSIYVAQSDNVIAYTGNGTSGIYIWGTQLVQGTNPEEYTITTSAPAPIQVMGPLGFVGAEKLVESAVNIIHYTYQGATTSANTSHTLSVYCKAAERTQVDVRVGGLGWAVPASTVINLSNGSVISGSGTVVSVGSGWYRISITGVTDGTIVSRGILIAPASGGTATYTGDGTSGIYIFGAQLSDSDSLDPYSYNFGAAPTSSAYYGPRFDYDPVTLAPKGLLIEEQRTNICQYSGDYTNWTLSEASTSGVFTTPTGSQSAIFLASTNALAHRINKTGLSVSTSPANVTYCYGAFIYKPEDSDVGRLVFRLRSANGNGQAVSFDVLGSTINTTFNFVSSIPFGTTPPSAVTSSAITIQNYGNGVFRISIASPASASTDNINQIDIGFGTTAEAAAGTINTKIGVWGLSVEAGSFPTSYIPTTSASVTRTADNASMVGTNFSSWYNQSEGTVTVETDVNYPASATGYPITIGVNFNDSLTVYRQSDAQPVLRINTAGVNYYLGAYGNVWSDNLVKKLALGYQANNTSSAYNGLGSATDTTVTLPVATQLSIGSLFNSSSYINGHLKSFKFFSKRFINTYLQSLTQ